MCQPVQMLLTVGDETMKGRYNMDEKIDFLAMLEERKEREKRADELRRSMRDEVSIVKERYKDMLGENDSVEEDIERMRREFNTKWQPQLNEYNKCISMINRKYKKLAKSI